MKVLKDFTEWVEKIGSKLPIFRAQTASVLTPLVWIFAIQSVVCASMQRAGCVIWLVAVVWSISALGSVAMYVFIALNKPELLQSEPHRERMQVLLERASKGDQWKPIEQSPQPNPKSSDRVDP